MTQLQSNSQKKKDLGFQPANNLFSRYKPKVSQGYISQEFQDFGYRLALDLNDLDHKSLYMRMAKKEDRAVLEKALSFVSDSQAKSKARLFMWKVKQLKEEKKLPKNAPSSLKNEKSETPSLFDALSEMGGA